MQKIVLTVLCYLCVILPFTQAATIPLGRALIAPRQAIAPAPVTPGTSASVSKIAGSAPLPTTREIASNGINAAIERPQVQDAHDTFTGASAVATPSGTSNSAIASSCLNNDISTVTDSWLTYTVCFHDPLPEFSRLYVFG